MKFGEGLYSFAPVIGRQWFGVPLKTARRREGLRKVYRAASPQTEAGRESYLYGLSDVALSAINSGKSLIVSSAGGTSASYAVFNSWAPNDVVEFVDWARGYISESDIDLALAEVSPRVLRFQTSTTNLRVC